MNNESKLITNKEEGEVKENIRTERSGLAEVSDKYPAIIQDMQLRIKIIELLSNPSTDKETQASSLRLASMYLASLSKCFFYRESNHPEKP